MPASNYMPDVTVEVAFDSGYTTAAADRTWTDVSEYVEAEHVARIARGRPDQFSTVQPSRLSLTLDNTDGRFTPENTAGAYYPNVKKGRPIRVRVTTTSVISEDSFTGADDVNSVWAHPSGPSRTTPTGGHSWVGSAGDWGISGNQAYDSAAAAGDCVADVGVADCVVSCTYSVVGATNTGGMTVRRADASNRITVEATGGSWRMRKFVAGAPTVVDTGGTSASDTTYTLRVEMSGSNVEVFVDDVSTLQGTISDAALLSATSHGFRSGGGSTHRWDDFSVTATTVVDRFTGYVDEWPVEWPDGTASQSVVTVTASSRRARLGRSAAFRSIVEEEILYDDPVLYYPLGEPEGATQAGNIAPGRSERLVVTQYGTGGTLAFGAGTGPGTDGLSAPILTPVSSGNGLALLMTPLSPICDPSDTVLDVEVTFNTSLDVGTLVHLPYSSDLGVGGFSIELKGGTGEVQATATGTGLDSTAASVAAVDDGLTHRVSARFVRAGSDITASIVLDDAARVTGTTRTWAFPSQFPDFPGFVVGGNFYGTTFLFDGTLSHAAVYSSSSAIADARIGAHYDAGVDGFAGESSGARVERYARLAGVPTAEIDAETGLSTSIAHIDTTGRGPVEAMDDVTLTEDGVVFDAPDGTLTFHGRDHRYNTASAFTLDVNEGYVQEGLTPKLDDQGLVNDMSASREGGTRARETNEASIEEYGHYRQDVELFTTSDNEVQDRADWTVGRLGEPHVTIPSVRVDLLNAPASLQASLLAAEIGDRFTLDNLHSQAPETTMDFFIEGISEEIGSEGQGYFIEFNVSAAVHSEVWSLDSATASQLGETTILAY